MKLKKFFEAAVDLGIEYDPRSRKQIEKMLKKFKDREKKAEGKAKEYFDTERTWNPYSDCRIINGTGDEEFSHILCGVDIETPELLLVDRLRAKGMRIDGVLIHHPEGRALANLEKVMPLQIDLLAKVGVPVNHSEALLRPRMDKIWRSIHADNLFRTERAAELLDIPAVCCHTITDNMVWAFMEKHICKREYDDMGEIMNAILELPEYKMYAAKGNPPIIANGGRNSRPGKVVATEFTGGTNGPEEFFEAKSRAGVGTVLSMHVTEKSLEEAKKHHVNVIQCSHMASDSLGINLMLDAIKKDDPKMKVIEASGFIRVEKEVVIDLYLILGVIGMSLILVAFLLLQTHYITADDFAYDALNFFGSGLLVIYGIAGQVWPFVILNGIFGLYSLIDMYKDTKSKKRTLLGLWRHR